MRARNEEGSAPIEFVFGVLFVLLLLFGVIEVAFALYGRNVVASSAHEAARAAVEIDASTSEAEALATSVVERSAGNLVEDYTVDVATQRTAERVTVRVLVEARLDPPGPLPVYVPVRMSATSSRETLP